MATKTDVLIIGGGVIGVCSAHYLAERGARVTLVEQGDLAAGSSAGNAGLIVPSHSIPLAAPGALAHGLRWMLDPESPFFIRPRLDLRLLSWLWVFLWASRERPMRAAIPVLRDLSRLSLALYAELAELGDLAFDFRREGVMYVFTTPASQREGLAEARLLDEFGLETQVLDAAAARAREPALGPGVLGGLYFPQDAHLDPAALVQGLGARAGRCGVCVHTHTEVLGFEVAGRRVQTVHTTRGDFAPDQVVLAAGAWTPRLARQLALNLPIEAAKGYSITVKRPSAGPRLPLLLGESMVAVTPLGPLLRFGGTLEMVGLDFSINRRRVEAILRAARQHLTGLEALETVEIWRGLRPCTPDGLPIIGRAPEPENVVVASGHAMVGMSLGPVTGLLVAQLLSGETPALDLRPLRVERFS